MCIRDSSQEARGGQPSFSLNTGHGGHHPTSTHAQPSFAHRTHSTTHFLPGNGPLHLAPSHTHQPEILLLHKQFEILSLLVSQILEHPMAAAPVPDSTMFADYNAYCLYYQYHCSIVDLGRATMRLMRARRLLQFVPGPPGLPGQYRLDPTVRFPPHTEDFLAASPTSSSQSPTRPHSHSSPPRERSRSRDHSAS